MEDDKKWMRDVFWISARVLAGTFIVLVLLAFCGFLCGCDRKLRKENEQLREELAKAQQYVPLKRDTIRDTVEVITQQVVEVEKVKEVLTTDDRELLKDLSMKVSELESLQKIGMSTTGEVTLSTPQTEPEDKGSSQAKDSVLAYHDAWTDFTYIHSLQMLRYSFSDSLAIAVKREYKHRFLWWKWGTKGYSVKVANFNPHSTIRYNTYVKRRK